MKTNLKSIPKSAKVMTSKEVIPFLDRVITHLKAWSCVQCESLNPLSILKCASCGWKVNKNGSNS